MTNLKKTIMAIVTLGVSGVASSGTMGPVVAEPVGKQGFYAGIGVGGIGWRMNHTGLGTFSTATGLRGVETDSSNDGDVAVNGTLMGGYAWTFANRFFLGLEGYGNYTNISASDGRSDAISSVNSVSLNGSTSWDMNWVYGGRVLPGYQVTSETAAYGIIGYARSRMNLVTGAGGVAIDSFRVSFPSSSTPYYFNGYELGVGSMTNLTAHIALRADLIYTGYTSRTVNVTSATSFSSNKMQPRSMEGNVGLVYMFG